MTEGYERFLPDEAATMQLGRDLAKALHGSGHVWLKGDLGAGKTTLSRGMLRELGHEGAVKSPTFTLVEPYDLAGGQVFHFDLYRLIDADELEYVGIDDYFARGNLCLVEWPEKADTRLPQPDLVVALQLAGRARTARVTAVSVSGRSALEALAG